VLSVECFGRGNPGRLEFLPIEFDRSTRGVKTSRNPFADEVVRVALVQWWRSGLSVVPRQ